MSVSSSFNGANIGLFQGRRGVAEGKEKDEIVEGNQENPVNDGPVTQKDLVAIAVRIEKAIDAADDNAAVGEAELLYQKSLTYIRNNLGKNSASSVREEFPLQIAFKAIKLLTKEEIQYCDALKERLSAISALFAERVSSLALSKKRPIYPNTRIELLTDLALVICGIPETEPATHFEVECCGAAIHNIIPIDERVKDVVIDNALPLIKGALAAGAALSPAPIVEPFVDLIVDLFKERPKLWYPDISRIRREFLTVTQMNDLNKPEIQSLLAKWDQSHEHAMCFVQIFSRILKDPSCSEELKERVLLGDTPSLESFSKFQGNTLIPGLRRFFSSWKIRYLSVKTFSELTKIPKYREESIFSLACRLAKERDTRIGNFLIELYQKDLGDQDAWNAVLAQLNPQEVRSEDQELKQSIQGMIQGIDGDIHRNDEEISRQGEKLGHARRQAGGRIGEEEDPENIEKQIETLKVQTDELRHEKEKLESEMSKLDELQRQSLNLIDQAQRNAAM